jgi:type III secretion protein S
MLSEVIFSLTGQALYGSVILSCLLVGAIVAASFSVTILQLLFQIQDQSLAFVIKIAALGLALFFGWGTIGVVFEELFLSTFSAIAQSG